MSAVANDFLFIQSFLTVGVLGLMTLVLWSMIRLVLLSLKISEGEKNSFGLAAGTALFGWLLLSLALALLGFYHVTPEFVSPLVPIGFLLPVAIALRLTSSSATFRKIADSLPQNWLILLQLPRAGGVVFLLLYAQGRLPALFAIPSGVGDLVIGLSAPLVAFALSKNFSWSRKLAIAWNAVGILDLAVAIIIGILLALPPQYSVVSTTPSTELMTLFPLVLIPVFAVPVGLLLHFFSLRLLLKQS